MNTPTKPTNVTGLSSILWDKIVAAYVSDAAGHGADLSALPGISLYPGVGGSIYAMTVLKVLAAAAAASLDPIAFANREVLIPASEYVTAAFYQVLESALRAQGFGGGQPIFDTTRPLNMQIVVETLTAMGPQSLVSLKLQPAMLASLISGIANGLISLPPAISMALSMALMSATRA